MRTRRGGGTAPAAPGGPAGGRHRQPTRSSGPGSRLAVLALASVLTTVTAAVIVAPDGGNVAAAPVIAPGPDATFSWSTVPSTVPPPATDPTRTTRPAALPANEVTVPALGIAGPVVPVGIEAGGLRIPPPSRVGWWHGGAAVRAAEGTTLLAAHVNLDGADGVFAHLYRVRAGDRVYLTDTRARASTWAVVAVQVVRKSALPQSIFSATGRRRLVLVTCTGRLVRTGGSGRSYDSNLIVTALPIEPGSRR